ncbi:MAG: bile acid:sodium symporter [Flavobacteriaceae bacterium]|nr:bile acid:sodium symporter [Flavobacteriaceae bacterium]
MENIDQIQININSDNLWIVNFALGLVMFGIALDIKMSDFTNVFKYPKSVIVGVISQLIFVPLVTYLLILIIQPYPSIALGMIMVAACPGGNVSNFMSKLAGGNLVLSISLTTISTFAAMVLTPFIFAFYGNLYPPTDEILKRISLDPLEVSKLVLLILGIPLILGTLFQYFKPILASRFSKIMKPVSVFIFLTFIIVAFLNNLDVFLAHVHHVFFLVILHNGLLFATGFFLAKSAGLNLLDQKTISIETGIQNSGLGLMLVFTFFENLGGMAILVAFWAIWDMVSGLLLGYLYSLLKGRIRVA